MEEVRHGCAQGCPTRGTKASCERAPFATGAVWWREGAQAHGLGADPWTLPRVAWQRSSNASPVSSTTPDTYGKYWVRIGADELDCAKAGATSQRTEPRPSRLLEDRALARAKIETLSVKAPGSSFKTKLDSPVTLGAPDLGTAGGNTKLWNRIRRAWVALLLVAQLYSVEQQAQPMAPEDRLQLRQRQSRPILDRLRDYLD